MISSKNKVSKLKEKINQCQDETHQLLQDKVKQRRSEKSKLMDQTRKEAEADLGRQKTSKSQKVEDLKKALKNVEDRESDLRAVLERSQIRYAEYKKTKDVQVMELHREIDELEKILSDESGVNKLHKRRVKIGNRYKKLDVFCAAMYSTLDSKEFKKHI